MKLRIQSISPAGLRWIHSASPKRILHVFRPVCNLIDAHREVLSLVRREVGNGPFSGIIEDIDFLDHVAADSGVSVKGQTLQIADLQLDFSSSDLWAPQPNWTTLRNARPKVLAGLREIEQLVAAEGPPQSLAELVLDVPQHFANNDPVFARANIGIEELIHGLQDEDIVTMRNGAERLAGLGIGLTPAGDDFLVGSFLALWATYSDAKAETLALTLAEEAAPKTNSLSAAWLRASAVGAAPEHWHGLFDSLLDLNTEGLSSAVRAILPTGHTSGADSLGGFVATMRILMEQRT